MQTAFQAALACTFLWAAGGARALAEAPALRPGGVVRWPGESIERCGLEERSWAPLDGACWYPVDLLSGGTLVLERWRGGERETRSLKVAAYPYDVQRLTIADQGQVDLSPENLARVDRESARVAALWSREGSTLFTLPLAAPLADLPAGGRFGARRIINDQPRSPHTGVDYSADEGEPVLAVADGHVVLAEEHFFSGASVFVDHGGGLVSMYFHLSEIAVAAGDRVTRGQRLGAVGATGRATGPHLHFGLRWHGARIDPGLLLGPPAAVPVLD